jgi:S1-C subfamily serine protease
MKNGLLILLVGAVSLLAPAFAAAAESDSDMLERTIGGVVTVAIYKGDDYNHPYGFGASDAYAELLNLSDALASGSGFCIEQNGKKYIVTNCHVIEGAAGDEGSIVVYSLNRTKYPMKIVGADSFIDIAVLEFDGKDPGPEFTALKFTDAPPRLGETVFAIGNPYGDYPYAISKGIVGGLNRVREGLTGKYGYIQSTATIIWGNSGGPLVTQSGEVAGINTGIEIRERMNQYFVEPQINFALEASVAERAVNDIISVGHVRRAYLGVRFSQDFGAPKTDDDPEFVDTGAKPIIKDVMPDSPAAAQLAPYKGAVVTKIDDKDVDNIEEILAELESLKPGDDCTLYVDQNGHADKITVKTDELTNDRQTAWAQEMLSSLGWTVKQTDSGVTVQNTAPAAAPAPSGPSGGEQPNSADSSLRSRIQQLFYGTQQPSFQNVAPAAPAAQAPPELPLVALGLFDDKGNAITIWRANDLKELGVAVRLAASEGRIDLAVKGDQDKLSILRVWLSGQEGTLSRSLLY